MLRQVGETGQQTPRHQCRAGRVVAAARTDDSRLLPACYFTTIIPFMPKKACVAQMYS